MAGESQAAAGLGRDADAAPAALDALLVQQPSDSQLEQEVVLTQHKLSDEQVRECALMTRTARGMLQPTPAGKHRRAGPSWCTS